jgi:SAM-dependent methyltransferase
VSGRSGRARHPSTTTAIAVACFERRGGGHNSDVSLDVALPDLFDQPFVWRVKAAASLGLFGDDLIAAVSPGPAFPAALRSLRLALPRAPRIIVDLGAGGGGPSEWLRTSTGATVFAIEPAPGARRAARWAFPHLRVLDGRADRAPLPDGVADVVVLSGVLSLLDDIDAAMDEVDRLVTPSGSVAVADLFSSSPTSWSSEPNTFRSIEDLTRTLHRRGYDTVSVGCGDPVPDRSWSATAAAVDEWIDANCCGRDGYDAWDADRQHLRDHVGSGSVIGGCVVAARAR